MEQEDGNNASDAQSNCLQITDELFPQENTTLSNISDTKDQKPFSPVSSLKRQNSDLSDNIVCKKRRTEVSLSSDININSKDDDDEVLNFVKLLCTQITTSTADNYDTIHGDEILNVAEHDSSHNPITKQNGQKEMFDITLDGMNIENLKVEPSNEILPDVANDAKATINSAQDNEKEHDAEVSTSADKTSTEASQVAIIDKVTNWLKETSSNNSTPQSLKNLADKIATQEIAAPNINTEQIIVSWSLHELLTFDDEILPTEPMERDPNSSVDLLENVPLNDTVQCFPYKLTKLEDREILPTVSVVKDSRHSVNLLEAASSNGSIHSSDSLSELHVKEKTVNAEHDLVFDFKPLQICTRNAPSVKIGTPKVVELNDVSNNFETRLEKQVHKVFNLFDFQKNSNQSIMEHFPDNNQLQKHRDETPMIEEMLSHSQLNWGRIGSPRTESAERSKNQFVQIECNSSVNSQELLNFATYCNISNATKLNTDLKDTKDILDLDLSSSEFFYETETNFDTEQHINMIEIDSCITTLTTINMIDTETSYQPYQSDQSEEAIDKNTCEEQTKYIFNAENCDKNELDDCTLSLCSTDKSMSPVPIIGELITSSFDKEPGKFANDASTGFQENAFNTLKDMCDSELLIFSAYNLNKSANSCLEFLNSPVPANQNCYFGTEILSKEENIKWRDSNESTLFLKEKEDCDNDSGTFPQNNEEISSTNHSPNHRSSAIEYSPIKRSLLSPNIVDKKISKYSSKASSPFSESNGINEVIQMYLESHGRQHFSVQDVVNFVMEQSESSLSYFNAIHSARIFLRNALNAETLKMYNGKYVMKSSTVRTT